MVVWVVQVIWVEMGLVVCGVCLVNLVDVLECYIGYFVKLFMQEVVIDEVMVIFEVVMVIVVLCGVVVGDMGIIVLVVDVNCFLVNMVEVMVLVLMVGVMVVVKLSLWVFLVVYVLCELLVCVEWLVGVFNLLQGDMVVIDGLCVVGIDCLVYCGNVVLGVDIGVIVDVVGMFYDL